MRGTDVLVLGAGSAGCVVAARLAARTGASVRLIEAGDWPDDPDIADPLQWPFLQGRAFDWCYRTVPQAGTAGRSHAWPRGRAVGGSGCLHAMAHVEGHPEDFAAWAEAGGPRWSHPSLASAFRRCALPLLHPDEALNPVTRAYMEAGRSLGAPSIGSHNAGSLAGVTANTLTVRDGRRVTTADTYLSAVMPRPNLSVMTGTIAERLLIERDRVRGVVVRHAGSQSVLEADAIVVCLGAVASPLLLMRSGLGGADELARVGIRCTHDLPEVGRNLHDHLLAAGNVYLSRRPVPPSRLQHSESLMYLHGDDPARADGVPDCVLACVVLPVVTECFAPPPAGHAYTILCGVTHPTSRGAIRPGGPFAADAPIIDPAYLDTQHDRDIFRRSLRLARAIGHAAALDEWRAEEVLPGPSIEADAEIDAFLARAAMTHHHPVGTCALGRVVDADLRVRGVDNLFVVDASVIPRITSGPVNAAVVAIAETWASDVWNRSQTRTEQVA